MNRVVRKDLFKVQGESLPPGLYQLADWDNVGCDSILPTLVKRRPQFIVSDSIAMVEQHNGRLFIELPSSGDYTTHGDILQINRNGSIRVLLSRVANANTLLVTERCNNRCHFCSQPPKEQDDDILLGIAANALVAFNTDQIVGITGGEPLGYGSVFADFLNTLSESQCHTPLHILTNGRALSDIKLVQQLKLAAKNRYIVFGIPIYSHMAATHDEMVGARGAFNETIAGIINAAYAGFAIELRYIPTKLNLAELGDFSRFVVRAFPFIDQLSIMNLEPKGWARANWDKLYVSPYRYTALLKEAVDELRVAGIDVNLFNYPLCHLDNRSLHAYAVQSISDWKNTYAEECNNCQVKDQCCGYFSSADRQFMDKPRGQLYETKSQAP